MENASARPITSDSLAAMGFVRAITMALTTPTVESDECMAKAEVARGR